MGISLSPRNKSLISEAQRSLLISKCIEAGIATPEDRGLVEQWLSNRLGIEVPDCGDLTQGQFDQAIRVLEEEYGV